MKKSILKISGIFALLTIVFTACKDDEDTTAPIITLDGSNPYILDNIGDSYVEPGFTASDDEDGTITSKVLVTSEVDEDSAGAYEIHYEVTDNAGNKTDIHREVIVQNSLETNNPQYKGIYSITEVCNTGNGSYGDTISFHSTINNRIWFTRFGNFGDGRVYANISGNTVTIPEQNVVCGPAPQATRKFIGTGSINTNTSTGVTTMVINYTEDTNGSIATCTGSYTKN